MGRCGILSTTNTIRHFFTLTIHTIAHLSVSETETDIKHVLDFNSNTIFLIHLTIVCIFLLFQITAYYQAVSHITIIFILYRIPLATPTIYTTSKYTIISYPAHLSSPTNCQNNQINHSYFNHQQACE